MKRNYNSIKDIKEMFPNENDWKKEIYPFGIVNEDLVNGDYIKHLNEKDSNKG